MRPAGREEPELRRAGGVVAVARAGATMNHAEHSAPFHAKMLDRQVAESLARETGVPLELALRIYEEELRNLSHGARITQFVNVLASRRARMKLQQERSDR